MGVYGVGRRQTLRRVMTATAATALMLTSATGVALADTIPTSDDTVVTEPAPIDPIPTDPAPTDPAPTEPADPAPTDPAPTDPAPTDPEPTDPEPTKPSKPAKPETRKVKFLVDGAVITGSVKIPAGAVVTITGVHPDSRVEITHRKSASETFTVRESRKSRMYKSQPLPPATPLWVKVYGSDGSTAKVRVKTLPAPNTFGVTVSPREGSGTYGAGIPLRVTFSMPITNRAAVEEALVVETTKEIGKASWHWVSSTMAVFRPKDYWPGNTKITLNADLRTVEGAPGWWGPKISSTVKIGDQVIIETNFRTHQMTFIRNGVAERTFPISGGQAGWETKNGVKLITTHEKQRRLINPDPEEGWDVLTNYAMRLTQDGEFIHDAPWNYYIGRYNTSHGCTNMYLSDVKWVFENTRFGDIVESKGSSVDVSKTEYLAGYWNYSWKEWKAGSALR